MVDSEEPSVSPGVDSPVQISFGKRANKRVNAGNAGKASKANKANKAGNAGNAR